MATSTGIAAAERNHLLILAAAGILLLLSFVGFFTSQSSLARVQSQLDSVQFADDTLQSLGKMGSDISNGTAADFALMQKLTGSLDTTMGTLVTNLGATDEREAVAASWTPMKAELRAMQESTVPYSRVATNVRAIVELLSPAALAYGDAQERPARSSATEALALSRQQLRLQTVLTLARQTLRGGSDGTATAEALTTELAAFAREHRTLSSNGTLERDMAKSIDDALATADTAAAAITQDIQPTSAALAAASQLPALSSTARNAVAAMRDGIQGSLGTSRSVRLISSLAGLLALVLVAAYLYLSITHVHRRAATAQAQEQLQQQAILSLLDEITNLANGDLTGELTVTADFTGNIADSLNYTVQTLRGLVGTINETSVEIAAAASSTTERVEKMSSASEGQAREIVRATQAISSASRSLEEVAGRAEMLAEQAKGSVDTAHSGAATVGRTIVGMSTLREQIQDTAKRIKRLGESSQEIGNIIEFINDIAEQTNTLALNASIQAAMAGESGRGFAVVADEVQRLAERAANATRQIESLVKTIQADTQEAITSMERSTANVVGGAKSAEEAGLALTRIEASSQELAKVIQDIAGASRTQSAETTKLAGVMQGIREVSVQTSVAAHQTAEAVGELSTLSAKLRESVSGFKLPMEVSAL